MILDDVDAGRGTIVVDPKGDLVADLLARLPARLANKVVLFDAADRHTNPPCLNPLEGADHARAVDNLVSIFSRVYASSWGPRTDDILRSGLLTLTAQGGAPNLANLPKLLMVPAYRARALENVHDDVLADFWTWFDQLSDAARAQSIAPLMNKVRGFLLKPFVRAVVAGGPSTVDMNDVLDGGICLVRLAKDRLGMETARFLGSIVVARTWQAATRRARIPQRLRRDANLYIDEAHNFLNLPYALEDMLAESRAYRLSIVLAHQYLAQLTPELEEGISTNARTKIIFNASPEDARKLARHTVPRLTEHDLAHLGAFHAAARLVHQGEQTPAFTMRTEKMPPAVSGRTRLIKTAAAANTSRARQAATHGNGQPADRHDTRRPTDPRRKGQT
jgi:type IV secretory pathway TraG/TraD family ATPase VirD4